MKYPYHVTHQFYLTFTGHYDAKAFPSAGILPFMQNYLCAFMNPCLTVPTTGDDTTQINTNNTKQSLYVLYYYYENVTCSEVFLKLKVIQKISFFFELLSISKLTN